MFPSISSITDMVRRMINATNDNLQAQIDELKKQVTELQEAQYNEDLYEILHKERNTIANELGTKPFFILNNETLKELSRKKPTTLESLKQIKGIKDVKAEQYGERILQLIKLYMIEN